MKKHNPDELLAMYRVIEAAKDAIEQFEAGEVSVCEAVRLIRAAAVTKGAE
jgi:hypothetical protein